MIKNIDEARAKAQAMFVNFSDIIKKTVLDSDGKLVGRVWDVSIKLGDVYPKADELIIYRDFWNRTYATVCWRNVINIEDDIIIDVKSHELKFEKTIKGYEFLLRRNILDQQVVDTFNHKVRRVNDVHMLKVDHELVLAHVDTGMKGLLRRLDFEKILNLITKIFHIEPSFLKKDELISWKYVQPVTVNPASMTMKLSVSEKQLAAIPAADLGDIIFDLDTTERMALFRTLDQKTKSKVFENLELSEQKLILRELDKKEAAQIITYMSPDEATDFLERLPKNTVKNLLTLVESNMARKLSTLLGYSSDSAGGLMTTEFVSMPETMLVSEAIEYIKTKTKDVETVPYIYVVDEKNHLKGATTIRRLLFADGKDTVTRTVFPKTVYVYLNNSVKEVAYILDKYKTSAIPVVDENKTLHGIITVDDILSQLISIAWARRPAAKGI